MRIIENNVLFDAKQLWKYRDTATESEFIELAYSMIMQRYHIGASVALDEARIILKSEINKNDHQFQQVNKEQIN